MGKYGSCLAQGKNSYVETEMAETVHMQTLYVYILCIDLTLLLHTVLMATEVMHETCSVV